MKQIVAENPMLTYPQFGKPFLVHTDASEKQIGGVVTQDDKPLGFLAESSRTHNDGIRLPNKNY
jgi:hypothetical protein